MSLYHLDPRQTGTGAAFDLDLIETQWGWRAADLRHDDSRSAASRLIPGTLKTEAEALANARQMAGFGHVAEQPCARFIERKWAVIWARTDPAAAAECADCAWPRNAHRVRA